MYIFCQYSIQEFPQEKMLFQEIDMIMRAVQASNSLFTEEDSDILPLPDVCGNSAPAADVLPSDDKTHFHSQLFYALPKSLYS